MQKFRHDALTRRYGFSAVSATQVCISGVTEAARKLPHKDQLLVCKQMLHSAGTSAMHYETIAGPSHAAKAFPSMQQLQLSSSSDSDKCRKFSLPTSIDYR